MKPSEDARKTIAPEELRTQIDLGSAPVVLDVRTAGEYETGHVPGALNVPFWRLLTSAPPGVDGENTPLVVYCGHGPRARIAMAGLRRRGFSNVSELDGHWAEWRRMKLPTATGGRG